MAATTSEYIIRGRGLTINGVNGWTLSIAGEEDSRRLFLMISRADLEAVVCVTGAYEFGGDIVTQNEKLSSSECNLSS